MTKHEALLKKIWRFNPITGYWGYERDSYPENVDRWLELLRGDEPGVAFRESPTRPQGQPLPSESKVGISDLGA